MNNDNNSGYINELLKLYKQLALEKAVLQANIEESGDRAYQKELMEWDVSLEL
ncbi:MAG: hypothetical protein ABL867_11240 [Rickettsiales bacterium]